MESVDRFNSGRPRGRGVGLRPPKRIACNDVVSSECRNRAEGFESLPAHGGATASRRARMVAMRPTPVIRVAALLEKELARSRLYGPRVLVSERKRKSGPQRDLSPG